LIDGTNPNHHTIAGHGPSCSYQLTGYILLILATKKVDVNCQKSMILSAHGVTATSIDIHSGSTSHRLGSLGTKLHSPNSSDPTWLGLVEGKILTGNHGFYLKI
jgi:hypothetical protein